MKVYTVYPFYQTPGGPGSPANNIVIAEGIAIRIEPIPGPSGSVLFPPVRHILLDESAQVNVPFSGTGWVNFSFKSFQFSVELTGTALSDGWNVFVAEKGDDIATHTGVGISFAASFGVSPNYGGLLVGPGVIGSATLVRIQDGNSSGAAVDSISNDGNLSVAATGGRSSAISGSVTAGTPVQINTLFTVPAGYRAIGMILSTTSASGNLHLSFGSSGGPGYYLNCAATPQSSEFIPANALGQIWLEASVGTIAYEAVMFFA